MTVPGIPFPLDGSVPFALIHRSDHGAGDALEFMSGPVREVADTQDLPGGSGGAETHQVLALVPHCQVRERGFQAHVDEPMLAMDITSAGELPLVEALTWLPDVRVEIGSAGFSSSDEEYAALVREVMEQEIGAGQGSNFVIKRSFTAEVSNFTMDTALTLLRRLLMKESGAYWTFLIYTGHRIFVGATPERHISLTDGVAAMTPISGTYRYPPSGATVEGVLQFLRDQKETDELFMVLDEELKMLARMCPAGGRVTGPFLREMAWLAHTEYVIEGETDLDARVVLRESLVAPTVTGSPVENACRVIARYEPEGRGYYGGVAALITRGSGGRQQMDSAILIRTAQVTVETSSLRAQVDVGVGATLVKGSVPGAEVIETHAKAAGVLSALGATRHLSRDPQVASSLGRRNHEIAQFWLATSSASPTTDGPFVGRSAVVIDAEDSFSFMLAHLLSATGFTVTTVPWKDSVALDDFDLVVLGPGPGDPNREEDPRVQRIRGAVRDLLGRRAPFLAVCLSHQVLCRHLDLPVRRRPKPNQGSQQQIDLFGDSHTVGYYNSFSARFPSDEFLTPSGQIQVARDRETNEVHALRGFHFASVQFHLESVLTRDGVRILTDLVSPLIPCTQLQAERSAVAR